MYNMLKMATLRITAVVIILMHVLVEFSASDIINEVFEVMLDSAPRGEPFQNNSVRSNLECASFCTRDINCTTYTTSQKGMGQVECKMYVAKETEHETGVKTYRKYDVCNSPPCENGGVCVNTARGYSCVCPGGFSGDRCTQDIEECASSPCENGATCLDLVNAYNCTCLCGWSGQRCDVAVQPPAPCTGYVRAPGGHYYLYESRKMTWQAAQDLCAASTPGAYLAEVNSRTENDYVYSLLGQGSWLGGRRVSGEWTWSHSGGRLADIYTRWAPGQPDLAGDCLVIYKYSGEWGDGDCSGTWHTVCEHDG